MNWPEEDVNRELEHIEMWGKSSVFGIVVKECQGTDLDASVYCAWGTCHCPIDYVTYAWHCWCCDGEAGFSWQNAMLLLEGHMFGGLHK